MKKKKLPFERSRKQRLAIIKLSKNYRFTMTKEEREKRRWERFTLWTKGDKACGF